MIAMSGPYLLATSSSTLRHRPLRVVMNKRAADSGAPVSAFSRGTAIGTRTRIDPSVHGWLECDPSASHIRLQLQVTGRDDRNPMRGQDRLSLATDPLQFSFTEMASALCRRVDERDHVRFNRSKSCAA